MILKKVDILKPAYFHVFKRKDGSTFEVETIAGDYKQLETPEHIDPIQPDAVWTHSYAFYKFSTLSGQLEDSQYADEGIQYLVGWKGTVIPVDKSKIVDSEIETETIAALDKESAWLLLTTP